MQNPSVPSFIRTVLPVAQKLLRIVSCGGHILELASPVEYSGSSQGPVHVPGLQLTQSGYSV